MPVDIIGRKGAVNVVRDDEHPRADTTIEQLSRLKTPFRRGGVVTAGNASGVNDGAAALIIASSQQVIVQADAPGAHCGHGDGGRRAEIYGAGAGSGGT